MHSASSAWLARRLAPRTPMGARVRIELLRTVAQNYRSTTIANPVMAAVLGAIDLQWVSYERVLVWFAAVLACVALVTLMCRRVLARDYAPEEAGALTVDVVSAVMPFSIVWPCMVLVAWVPGDPTNNAFLVTFMFASMAGGIALSGPCLHVAVPSLAVDLPILATHTIGGSALMQWLAPPLQVVAGLFISELAFTFHKVFKASARGRLEKEDLVRELAIAADALAEARNAAVEANAAKSAFLAGMSHELRTPLNAIIGFSDMIQQRVLGPLSPPRYGEYVQDIRASGLHLLGLINDILDIAKIEAGKREFTDRELDIGDLARDVLGFVEPQALKAGVALQAETDGMPLIRADERALKQILTNLLSNAVKFGRRGGWARIFAERRPSGSLRIGVVDNGIGMSASGLKKAMEPYGQAGRGTTVEGSGTGLGLPIVKALIEAHGAVFGIESAAGAGTLVWGEFPASRVVDAPERHLQRSA